LKTQIRNITIILAVIILLPESVFGQKHVKEGNKYYDRNMFEEAIPFYIKELEKGDNYRYKNEAREKLASCYRLTGRFLEANEIYKKILDRSLRFNKSDNALAYANSLKSSALYEEAAEQFRNYIELEPDDPMGKIYLKSCAMAQKWLDEPDEYYVMNLREVNTKETDFSPAYYNNGLVITSSREGSKEKFINFSGIATERSTDLFYVNLNSLDNAVPEIVNMDLLNSFQHDGAATFSKDGTEVFFTRTVMGEKDKKTNLILNSLQVYTSKMDETGMWSEPVSAFSFNSEEYSIGQPCLSPDGKMIYFMSDMPGGHGNTDIYFSTRHRDGDWSDPVNIGEPINTFGYELAPFIMTNDTIYFSSDTHPGMGKLDIFYSVKKDGKWSQPKNMKPPINSIGDDLGIVFDNTHQKGLFSSDRFNGNGKEDIYTFYEIDQPLQIQIIGNEIRIRDDGLYNGLSFKIAKEENESMNLEYSNGVLSYVLEEDSLYHINIRKNRFYYDKINLKITRNEEDSLFVAQLSSSVSNMLLKGKHANPKMTIRKRTLPSDKKNKGEEVLVKYDTIINNIPIPNAELVLEEEQTAISAVNSDSLGYYSLKDTLKSGTQYTLLVLEEEVEIEEQEEEKMAEVNEPLVKEPIKEDPIADTVKEEQTVIEEQPVDSLLAKDPPEDSLAIAGRITDEKDAGIPDVKIKVFSEEMLEAESQSDQKGDYKVQVPEKENYAVNMNKEGYYKEQITLSKEEVKETGEKMNVKMPPITTNTPLELKNILFDFDKSTFKKESISELTHILDFLNENPDVVIQLNAHTDARGGYYYNIWLSQKRAASVREYLLSKGIDENRIISHGLGESFPLVKNAYTEEQHSKNRRVEFSVYERGPEDKWYFPTEIPVNTSGFSILNDGVYSKDNPFTKNANLPSGLFYRIKIAEFKKGVDYNVFKGLFPIIRQQDKKRKTQEYYAGLFTSYNQAEEALKTIKKNFFDAYVIAYYNNEPISIKESLDLYAGVNKTFENNIIRKTIDQVPVNYNDPIFSVQVGAYRRTPDPQIVLKYRNIAKNYELIEIEDDKNTVYAIGRFASYKDAFAAKQDVKIKNGINDAFIIAIWEGEKITINEANKLLANTNQ